PSPPPRSSPGSTNKSPPPPRTATPPHADKTHCAAHTANAHAALCKVFPMPCALNPNGSLPVLPRASARHSSACSGISVRARTKPPSPPTPHPAAASRLCHWRLARQCSTPRPPPSAPHPPLRQSPPPHNSASTTLH